MLISIKNNTIIINSDEIVTVRKFIVDQAQYDKLIADNKIQPTALVNGLIINMKSFCGKDGKNEPLNVGYVFGDEEINSDYDKLLLRKE